jgi:RNA polymerase sigma factor (sigma-70 family)
MLEDAELLRRYAAEKSEPAFAELVRRHVNFVYACALRRVGGDRQLAEDVTQHVFTALARDAAALAQREVLSGWLFTTARNASAQVVRTERRRLARETEAQLMNELTSSPAHDAEWERLRPVLDDALDGLNDDDRQAVLLRYFEGKSFAEVGVKLRLTENTARMRVERALDKLHALLARRGVTSTTAALGLALANQAGVAAPAGLAASVTGAALRGALTAGSGATASLSLLHFMSMTKIVTGVVAVALALSVTANGYLLSRPAVASADPAPASAAIPTAAATVPLAVLARGDVAVLRDKLRAAGASEAMTRGVVEGVLRRRYREKLSAQRAEQMRTGWWKDSSWWYQTSRTQAPPRFVDDRKLLREMVLDPLDQLFGPDPDEVAEREAPFEFLPADKRAAFAALERDYAIAMSRLAGAEQNSPAGSKIIRERDERRQQVLATLSPDERAEYDLRFSPLAARLHDRMDLIGATEPEYRAIMGVIPASAADGRPALTAEQEQAMARQLVAALGYDRALDYVWAGAWEYPTYVQIAREAGLPAGTAARVLELAAETTEQARAIHANEALDVAEKRAALAALQAQVRPALNSLLPPAQQQRIGGEVLTWFTALGDGHYRFIPTGIAMGTGSIMIAGNASVETPLPRSGGRTQFVLRRPGGGGK